MDVQQAGRPVVVGVDGSESSEQAVRWAAREAARRKAPLRVVQAVDPTVPPHKYGDPGFGPDVHEIRLRGARAHLKKAARAASEEAPRAIRAAGDSLSAHLRASRSPNGAQRRSS
jgi:nucleotide-binding universal stress UspA family protein